MGSLGGDLDERAMDFLVGVVTSRRDFSKEVLGIPRELRDFLVSEGYIVQNPPRSDSYEMTHHGRTSAANYSSRLETTAA